MTEGAGSNSEQDSDGPSQAQDAASGKTRQLTATSAPTQRPSGTRAEPLVAVRRQSLYERLTRDIEHDHKVSQEVRMGKRVGFYKLKGQLGTGNFSKVKLGVHLLTTGKLSVSLAFIRRPCLYHNNICCNYDVQKLL